MVRPKTLVLFAVLFAACSGCGTSNQPKVAAAPDGMDWRWYFGSRPAPYADDPIIAEAQKRAVSIISTGGACSGGVGATGIVLTASHCFPVGPNKDIFVNGQLASVIANLGGGQFDDDLLFLKVQSDEFKPLEFAEPKVDAEIFEVVIQGEYRGVVKRGRIVHVWGNMFSTDIESIPGSSGAFVYTKDGQLVGIITQLSFGMVRCISGAHIKHRLQDGLTGPSIFNYGSI